MAVRLELQQASWTWEHRHNKNGKRKCESDIEMSSVKKRRPNTKSYTVNIYEQPRSMWVSFLNHREMPSSLSYIVGEKSKAEVQTDPSLLLSNFRGMVKLIWYLVEDDVRYPHPYILEGDDCVEGVCTKTIKAKGEAVSFPGMSIRKVSRKEMDQVLLQRVDRLKQYVPGMEFKVKSLGDYNLKSVKICFQALPQDAVNDYTVILKPVMTRQVHSKDPVWLNDPCIMSISECKGTVHGKTEVTLLVSNLKTDDVLVFFHHVSLHPRSSWQAFAEILSITQTKHRQASILIHTPPFHNRCIAEPKTIDVEIRLRDNSCSNKVKYTYTPTTQVVNRIQRRVKQKEPIYVNYFSCLGAVTNVSPLVPKSKVHQDDDTSTSDETPKTPEFDMKPGKQQPKTLSRKEDKNPCKLTSLPLPVGQSLEERKLEVFDSKEETGEADSRVDPDHLSRYLSLTNLNISKESMPNGLPSHGCHSEEPDKEHKLVMAATGASNCKTIQEEKHSDFKLHSPSRENSLLSCEEGFTAQGTRFCQEENKMDVPYENDYMDLDDLSKEPSLSKSNFVVHSELSHLSNDFIPTVCDNREAANLIGKGAWEPNADSGFGGSSVVRSSSSAVVIIPTCISEQRELSIFYESTPTDSLEKERCTSDAEKDGKNTPPSQTTSPEAVNTTNDQQGAERNENLRSSQNKNKSASEDGNRESNSHDHKGDDEKEEDKFRKELRPPRATQRIDHRGGIISLAKCDITLTIPPGALAEGQEEEIVLSVDWNDCHMPPLESADVNVAPIVTCNPTGLKFLKPVSLKIPHCAILPNPEKCKVTVHCSETDEEKEPNWERLPRGGNSDVQVECEGSYFHLHTYHFTSFSITVNKVETVGKEIMFVSFGKVIDSVEEDQVIRMYLYDFYGSNWEKIRQHEKNFGGKQLDTPVAYQVLELYRGSVAVEMVTYTPGWLLDTDIKISFPFDTIWNIQSWNRCKFLWTNKTGCVKFSCKILAKQSHNENELSLDISNHVKIPPKSSSLPRQSSLGQQAVSGPEEALMVDIHDNQFIVTDSCSIDSGVLRSLQRSNLSLLPGHGYVRHPNDIPEPIICYPLRLELGLLLDQPHAFGNDWKMLASSFGYDKYISNWASNQAITHSFSPTIHILILLEQDRKICSFADLEKAMNVIKRPDAIEVVAKFRRRSNHSNSSPPSLCGLTDRQAEQPMSTDNTPSPKDVNLPLTDVGQPHFGFQPCNDGDSTSQSERNEPVQSGSYPSPTSSSHLESTTPRSDCIPDDSTPFANNNLRSNAACKKLYVEDAVEELNENMNAFNLSNESFRSPSDSSK